MLRTASSVRMLQMLAAVLGIAMVLWTSNFGASLYAEAAAVTNASDTISDSAPSTAANHTIDFTTPNGLVSGETIVLQFEDGDFNLAGLDSEDDIDVAFNGAATTSGAAAAGAGVFRVQLATPTADDITLTSPTDGVSSSTRLTIRIGDHTLAGDQQIINPSATTSYEIAIGGTMQDSGEVRVAIVDQVTVSASVDTVFDFTVAGVASGSTVNSSPTTTATTTSSNALPFGTLTPGQSETLAHDLTVTTNAAAGFSVTVEQSGDLTSETGADINSFIDGADTSTPTAWTSPSAVIGSPDTYGHWGVTSDDTDFSGTADRWVAASTTPQTIFTHNTVANGVTTGEGVTRVGYQIQVSSLQEAATDYSTTLTYIATPVF